MKRNSVYVEREQKIVELRQQNYSFRQIGQLLNMNHGTAYAIAKKYNLDGIRGIDRRWKDNPNGYVQKYNPKCEYVSGWTSCEGYAVIRFTECGHEVNYSMKTLRIYPEYECPICKKERQKQEARQRKELEKQRKQQAKEERERQRKLNKHYDQIEFKECPVCHSLFVPEHKSKTYCSDACAKSIANQHGKDKRIRKLKHVVVDKDITLQSLYKRDGGVCWLCGEQCDWDDGYIITNRLGKEQFIAGDNYPSIDHVIPISKDGKHSWNNVKLAHRKCNIFKKDKLII